MKSTWRTLAGRSFVDEHSGPQSTQASLRNPTRTVSRTILDEGGMTPYVVFFETEKLQSFQNPLGCIRMRAILSGRIRWTFSNIGRTHPYTATFILFCGETTASISKDSSIFVG